MSDCKTSGMGYCRTHRRWADQCRMALLAEALAYRLKENHGRRFCHVAGSEPEECLDCALIKQAREVGMLSTKGGA